MNFTSREEIVTFERLLNSYLASHANFAIEHISLPKAFDLLQSRPDGSKVFSALFDIVVNLSLIWCDEIDEARTWDRLLENNLLERPFLDSEHTFDGRMDTLRYTSAFVFRYRALWDKIMGFCILFFSPEKYEAFASSKNKRRTFRKLMADSTGFPVKFAGDLNKLLEAFENQFRMPEAHGTGTLRKILLSRDGFSPKQWPTPSLVHWNTLNTMAHLIGALFDPAKRSAFVEQESAL